MSLCFLTYPPIFLLIDCALGTGGKRAREMLLLGRNESSVTADDELRYWSVLLVIFVKLLTIYIRACAGLQTWTVKTHQLVVLNTFLDPFEIKLHRPMDPGLWTKKSCGMLPKPSG